MSGFLPPEPWPPLPDPDGEPPEWWAWVFVAVAAIFVALIVYALPLMRTESERPRGAPARELQDDAPLDPPRSRQAGEIMHIGPQPGPQTAFLESTADIAIAGGAAGGGKTYALLLEPLRHVRTTADFTAVIFRRIRPQITSEGGLWDESARLYPYMGARPRVGRLEWVFPHPEDADRAGATVRFAQLQHDQTVLDYKSAQLPFIGYDQLEDLSAYQFWYMTSRLRSMTGIRPYVRATCNPDPDSFLRELLDWWIGEDGFAIPERSGQLRWFVRINDELLWADDPDTLTKRHNLPRDRARSLTFIPSTIDDNPALERADPTYRPTLEALPLVERERLLRGNWKIRPAAGLIFNLTWFGEPLPASPAVVVKRVRYWDKASTAVDPRARTKQKADWTAGVLGCTYRVPDMGPEAAITIVEDVIRGQWKAGDRETVIAQTAKTDPPGTITVVEQEAGGGGKDSARYTVIRLAGYPVFIDRPSVDLLTRAQPLAAQAQVGNVRFRQGRWNADWLREMHNFTGRPVDVDDQVSATVGMFKILRFGVPRGDDDFQTVKSRG